MRPVCGASDSNNGPLSDLLSQICMQLGDEIEESIHTLCISQEEMCGGMDEVNRQKGDQEVGGVLQHDVPSMVVADVATVVRE